MVVAALGFRFLLSAIFLFASAPKLLARADFERAVINYEIVPRGMARFVARVLPTAELIFAVALFAGFFAAAAAAALSLALMTFAFAAGINLLRGRRMECGCFGRSAAREISWRLVAIDAALAGGALLVALEPGALEAWRGPWTTSAHVTSGTVLAVAAIATVTALVAAVMSETLHVRGLLAGFGGAD